ncbi:MAG: DUF3987 domain-containing protein [Gemmataceae bacterium]
MGILHSGAAQGLEELPPDGCAIRGEEGAAGKAEPRSVAELAVAKGLPEKFLREQGLFDLPRGGIGITYFDADGQKLFVRERGAPGSKTRFRQPAGVALQPYGLWWLADQGVEGVLYVAEGETDALTLWHHGLAALGLPGSNTCRALLADHLAGVTELYAVPDNDQGGRAFRDHLRKRLAEVGYAGRAHSVHLPDGVKDVNELHLRSPQRFRDALDGLARYASEMDFRAPDETPRAPDTTRQDPSKSGFGRGFVSFVGCRAGRPLALGGADPFVPFPTGLLPTPLARFVRAYSAAAGCDEANVALPALAVCASAIGNAREVRLNRTWAEAMALWAVVVGESGVLKTPPFKAAMQPLYDDLHLARQEHGAAMARFEQRKAEHKEAAALAKDGGHAPPPAPLAPAMRRTFCSDVTIEKLLEILEDNPKGVLLARDELAGWIGSFTRYSKGGSGDVPHWLQLYSGGTVTYDRKTGDRRSVVVEQATASVAGGIQPGVLARLLTAEHFESGLAARLLMAWPPRRLKRWSSADIDEGAIAGYCCLVERLLALRMREAAGGRLVPHGRRLSPEAEVAWVNFYNDFAREQADAEGAVAAMLSKVEGMAARLALLHHVSTLVAQGLDDDRDIDVESVEAGVGLARWFAREHRRIYAAMGKGDDQKQFRRLAEWVQAREGAGPRPATFRGVTPRAPRPPRRPRRSWTPSPAPGWGTGRTCRRPTAGGGRPGSSSSTRHPTQPTQPPSRRPRGSWLGPDTTPAGTRHNPPPPWISRRF